MNKPDDEVVLHFRPLADNVPWPHRVRRLLKYALRVCNLRCERIVNLPKDGSPASDPNQKLSCRS